MSKSTDKFSKFRDGLPKVCHVKPILIEVREPDDEYDFDTEILQIVPAAVSKRIEQSEDAGEFAGLKWLDWLWVNQEYVEVKS